MNYNKLSAGMAALVEELRSPGGPALTSDTRAVPPADPLADSAPEAPPAVFAYVRCDSDAVIEPLPGVNVHSERGRARTALLTLEGIDRLSEQEYVSYISPAVMLEPLCDVAALRTGLPAFKSNGGSGRGVVIGVIDSGIDADHPAFAGRIHSIWDQTMPGPGWETTSFGSVLTKPSLSASLDKSGHGTHVAGIAAGSDAQFGGVAPEADIVVVKTNFLNTGIGDGIRYVFHVAEQLGKPAVVNLSLGGHHDAHDGSDNLSTQIDDNSGPGRIVVAAAGNEGGDAIHGVAVVPPGQTADIAFNVPPNSQPGQTPFVRLNGWYARGGDCEISVVTSSGDATPFQPLLGGPQVAIPYNFTNAFVRLTTPPPNPNRDKSFLAELFPGPFSNFVQGGRWLLRVRNRQASELRVDVWSIVPRGARDAGFAPGFDSPDMKIGSPGCAAEAITVGSFTTRNKWQDATGAPRGVGLVLDTISDFSSPGPLRDGRRKPDVTAPGAMIVSCQSKDSSPRPSDVVGGGFCVNAGTSMACPFVTGLVALLLQADPTLDGAAVKARLQGRSSIPGAPAGAFDPRWGFGLIDVGSL